MKLNGILGKTLHRALNARPALNMKRRAGILGAACAVAMLAGGALTPAHAQTKLTYASFYGPDEFFETSAKYFMGEVTRRSEGKITFEPYYGGALLRVAESGDGLSRGVADIGVTVPAAFNPREFPLTGVVLPFVSENPYAVTQAFADLMHEDPAFAEQFRQHNQKPLWALAAGENSLWTNKPVRTFSDLKGMRIRSILGVAEALKAAGVTPVSIPWVEALELMQRGGVEGVSTTPFAQAAAAGTLDMAKYASNGGRMGNYTAVIWTMNLQSYERLSPEERAIIDDVAKDVIPEYFSRYEAEIDRNVELLEKSDVEYIHMDDAEVAKVKEIAGPVVYESWAKLVSSRTKVDPKAFYDNYVERVRKYEAQFPYVTGFDRYRQRNPR